MTIASMTGFGRAEGIVGGASWAWELRSVNGRGLDFRIKLPSSLETLEPVLREEGARQLRRGNVTAGLTVKRDDKAAMALDRELLEQFLRLSNELAARIPNAPPPRPEALLALPGVLRAAPSDEGVSDLLTQATRAGFSAALASLIAARREEGMRLQRVISSHLDQIESLQSLAVTQAAGQPERQRARLMETVQALLHDSPAPAPERIAQEVVLLAARSDVREELDRLQVHIEGARALLADGTAVGRRLDFLIQEFVRETNTMCSKSATGELTATGLQLKAVIEQMREQVQNVE